MTVVRWWVTHDPAGGVTPFTLRCHLAGRTLLTSYPTRRIAESMAPALARALVQATHT